MLYTNTINEKKLHLVIHTTKACNFRCKYCYMDFRNENITKDTQQGIINFVEKNINDYDVVQLGWFGGEPTLCMTAIQHVGGAIKEICRRNHKPYWGSITTNGYLLTPENIKILMENRVLGIHVTIDGSREIHDFYRCYKDGSKTFDRIIQNLLYIKENIKTNTLTISIRTKMKESPLYSEMFHKQACYYRK